MSEEEIQDAKKHIARLGELNCADHMVGLADNLCKERQVIVEYLNEKGIIALEDNGGFFFLEPYKKEFTNEYLEAYDSF